MWSIATMCVAGYRMMQVVHMKLNPGLTQQEEDSFPPEIWG